MNADLSYFVSQQFNRGSFFKLILIFEFDHHYELLLATFDLFKQNMKRYKTRIK